MSDRIHLLVDPLEKEQFRRLAEREGKTLSEWLRDLARRQVEEAAGRLRLETPEDLARFFAECDAREAGQGREPDWEEHLRVIEESRLRGLPKP